MKDKFDKEFEMFLQGWKDWKTLNWNPPINKEDFINYCQGWDYVYQDDPFLNADKLYGFNDFPNSL